MSAVTTAATVLGALAAWSTLAAAWAWQALGPCRSAADRHWTERATLLMAARRRLYTPLVFLVAMATAFVAAAGASHWWTLPLLAWVGSYPARLLVALHIFPATPPRQWARVGASAAAVTWVTVGLIGVGMWAMPSTLGPDALAVLAVTLLLVAAHQILGAPALLQFLGAVRDAPPEVRALVDEEARALGVQVHRVGMAQQPVVNAYARPILGHVILTDGLLENFTDEELRAIVRHELTHLSEPPWTTAARLSVPLAIFAVVLLAKPVSASFGAGAVVLLALGALAVAQSARGLSQRMESRADHGAAQTDAQREAYARALERLHALNLLPVTHGTGANKSHPDLVARMRAAGVEPSWTVPPDAAVPASSGPKQWWRGVLVLGAIAALLLIYDALRSSRLGMPDLPRCTPSVRVMVVPDGEPPSRSEVQAALRGAGLQHFRGRSYAQVLPSPSTPSVAPPPPARQDSDRDSRADTGAPAPPQGVPAFYAYRLGTDRTQADTRHQLMVVWMSKDGRLDGTTFAAFREAADKLASALHGHLQAVTFDEPFPKGERVTVDDLDRQFDSARACAREMRAALGMPAPGVDEDGE